MSFDYHLQPGFVIVKGSLSTAVAENIASANRRRKALVKRCGFGEG
jgi:hypothetical protein